VFKATTPEETAEPILSTTLREDGDGRDEEGATALKPSNAITPASNQINPTMS
jgi:hypothetical protein